LQKRIRCATDMFDGNVRKLDDTVVSKPANESLDYTLYEDVIVVSGDSNEKFPSSQMFDD